MKRAKAIKQTKDGDLVFCPESDAMNADWIRSARLMKRAQAGDKEAAKELERLENTPMYEI